MTGATVPEGATLTASTAFFSVDVLELFYSVWMEVAMFGVAALMYLVFAGNFTRLPEKATPASSKVVDQRCSAADSRQAPYQHITRALRKNLLKEALDHAAECGKLPSNVATRMLTALSRCPLVEDRVEQITSLAGKIDACSLDAAVNEVLKHNDATACHRLYKIADYLSLRLSDRTLEAVVRSISTIDTEHQVFIEELCKSTRAPLGPKVVETLLSSCATFQRADLASKVFEVAQRSKEDAVPSVRVCAALVRAYAACKLYDKVCEFYEDVMQPGKVPVEATLAEVILDAATLAGRTDLIQPLAEASLGDLSKHAKQISACGKHGDLPGAFEVFRKLQQSGQPLTTLVYNCLLDACVQCKNLGLTLDLFAEMKDKCLVDVVSYNTLMKGYIIAGDMAAAERLTDEMVEKGLVANRITYHGLLNARVLQGDRRGAWALLEQMQAANVTPTAVTCSILLKSLASPAGAEDLTKVLELVDSLNRSMDDVLFASMVEACIRTHRLDLLSERTRMYAEQGGLMKLTAPTYGSMIKAYGQAQDIEQVWILWRDMNNRQVKPTPITLGCMVEALVTNQCVDDAWRLVQTTWQDESQKASVNTVIYSTILKGFSLSKQHDKVMELYDEMRSRDIPCNTITYNTLLNAFARCGAMHRVSALLEDMKNASPRVEPDIVTFSTIVKGYCMSGDVDKGFELLKEMQDDGKYSPDEVMFNSLLDGCAKQQRLEDALKLLEEMRSSDVTPSNYTLSILVKLLGRSRRLNQAITMVNTISKEYCFQPNVQVYTCLIQACFHNRQAGKALSFHDEIIMQSNCKPDEKTYNALVKGCLQAGFVDKAVAMVRCAFHVPGQSVPQSSGPPPGIESRCLDEVVAKLGVDSVAARELLADVSAQKALTSTPQRKALVTTNQRRVGGGRGHAGR